MKRNIPKQISALISCDPQRFAYSSFINKIQGLEPKLQYLLCSIIGKAIVTVDPIDSFDRLKNMILQRIPLAEELSERAEQIDLTLSDLVDTLVDIITLDKESVDAILMKSPQAWSKSAKLCMKALESGRPTLL